MDLELPGNSLESLYQISDQSIWFLIWILKQERFWKDLTKEVLEIPFTVQRKYLLWGQIGSLQTLKNNKVHGKKDRFWSDLIKEVLNANITVCIEYRSNEIYYILAYRNVL